MLEGVTTPPDRPVRVRPRVWIGFAVFLGYAVLVVLMQRLSGVPYTELGDTGGTLFRGAGISLIVGAILLAATTSWLGWWRPALFDRRRAEHRWPIVAPMLMAVLVLVNLAVTDWSAYDLGFFGASLALLLVGFTEELTTRGLLLTGLRAGLSEGWVWFLSTLAFGVMHYANVLGGQAFGPTSLQVLNAFLFGTTLYILRRVTGSLVWAMVLHALWDFSVFAIGKGHPAPLAGVVGIVGIVVGVLSLIAVRWVITGTDERISKNVAGERRGVSA